MIRPQPWLIINPHRVGVFDYIVGEATMRWTGAPISVSVRRLLQGFSVRLEFFDGSTMATPVTETEARVMNIVLAPNG